MLRSYRVTKHGRTQVGTRRLRSQGRLANQSSIPLIELNTSTRRRLDRCFGVLEVIYMRQGLLSSS